MWKEYDKKSPEEKSEYNFNTTAILIIIIAIVLLIGLATGDMGGALKWLSR